MSDERVRDEGDAGHETLPAWRAIVAEELSEVIGMVWRSRISQEAKEKIDREIFAAQQRIEERLRQAYGDEP